MEVLQSLDCAFKTKQINPLNCIYFNIFETLLDIYASQKKFQTKS